jgi:GNAT superfamily N-acetyltransferase
VNHFTQLFLCSSLLYLCPMTAISIRRAEKTDMAAVFQLVKELAEYEKAPEEVIVTEADYIRDGFGDKPLFGCLVAERNGIILGISFYYWRYSTWKGKRLYLEDLVVNDKQRGSGIGKLLFERTVQEAIDQQCSGMMWQILDWNEPAIRFYKKYDAFISEEWLNGSLDADQMQKIVGRKN